MDVCALRPRRPAIVVSALVVILGVLAGGARADTQSPTPTGQPIREGRLTGRVRDASGAPLPGVLVEAVRDTWRAQAWSDADGVFEFPALAGGHWTVRYSLPGFVTVVHEARPVAAAQTTHDEATLPLAASASVVVTGRRTFTDLSRVDSQDGLIGVADTASTGVITPGELEGRPRRRPADALESIPGVVVSQHSGEGKANQYYLRGFNLDHGTDVALSVAGMPVNLPTHAHGQGYADLNFVIPELISGIQYQKGPYAAEAGDFSAAGNIRMTYANVLDAPMARLEGGSFGYGRALAAMSAKVGDGHLLVAGESVTNDGPWSRPDALRKWNGLIRYSRGSAVQGLSITGLAYRASWNATDQIPQRAVEAGVLPRFGAVDRTNGGHTHRSGVMVEWQKTTTSGTTRVDAFGFDYGVDLFSNFTYFLADPERGDQFEQRDRRTVLGGRVRRTWASTFFGRRSLTTAGVDVRRDGIDAVGLYRTRARQRLSTVREDSVTQASGAVFGQLRTSWSEVVRTTVGLRADGYHWEVRAGDLVNGGRMADGIVTPKVTVALGPWARTEVYASAGGGFHSNDGRGATMRRDPVSGEDVSPVDPLVRARGAEVGIRTLAVRNLHTTVAVWGLWLDSELLFVGDAGTTAATRPSHRVGLEWDADYRVRPWLALDGSVAWSRARFTDVDPAGSRVPGATEGVAGAGIQVTPRGPWSGSLRWRYVGPRALVEDDSVRSRASHLVSVHSGRQVTPTWRLQADILNLLNSRSADIEYFYTSRLPGEAAGGVNDLHRHPAEPFSIRVALVARF